jgi:hypothetical protein
MVAHDTLPWHTGMEHVTITKAHRSHRPIGYLNHKGTEAYENHMIRIVRCVERSKRQQRDSHHENHHPLC